MPIVGYDDYNVRNWDGYDGDPITPETVALAARIGAMIEQPYDDAPGGDGSVCLEWRMGDDILCLDIGPNKLVRLYGKIGGEFIHSSYNQQSEER